MLSFLRIRAIVNGKQIYPLPNSKPVVIRVEENQAKVVITDGFHFTPPKVLQYKEQNAYNFKVVCVIGDMQLLAGGLLIGILYLAGFSTGLFLVKLFSFSPILYFLFFYYINRKEFLQFIRIPMAQVAGTGKTTRA